MIRAGVRKNVKEDRWQQFADRLGSVDGHADTVILSGVAWLSDRDFLRRIVSSNILDIYNDRDRIRASVGISVVSPETNPPNRQKPRFDGLTDR
jgi:hypothetical protein